MSIDKDLSQQEQAFKKRQEERKAAAEKSAEELIKNGPAGKGMPAMTAMRSPSGMQMPLAPTGGKAGIDATGPLIQQMFVFAERIAVIEAWQKRMDTMLDGLLKQLNENNFNVHARLGAIESQMNTSASNPQSAAT